MDIGHYKKLFISEFMWILGDDRGEKFSQNWINYFTNFFIYEMNKTIVHLNEGTNSHTKFGERTNWRTNVSESQTRPIQKWSLFDLTLKSPKTDQKLFKRSMKYFHNLRLSNFPKIMITITFLSVAFGEFWAQKKTVWAHTLPLVGGQYNFS